VVGTELELMFDRRAGFSPSRDVDHVTTCHLGELGNVLLLLMLMLDFE
jgi:hypothetical protein